MKDKKNITNRENPIRIDKNRNLDSNIDKILSNIEKKYILTEEEIKGIIEKREGEIVIPISIFNEKLGMLEASSLYLKDELNLSFNDIAKLLKRDYKTIWTSYNKAKKKIKNVK